MEASPFLSLLRQYMQREPAVLERSIVSNQERCKLEDKSTAACTQLTQAVVQKQGKMQTPPVPQTRARCGLTLDLTSSIASAVEVRLEQHKAALHAVVFASCWLDRAHPCA